MKRLILDYASKIHEWREAACDQRCQILDDINRGVNEQLGFGALIDVLGGVSKLK